jgi:hypothetical protein
VASQGITSSSVDPTTSQRRAPCDNGTYQVVQTRLMCRSQGRETGRWNRRMQQHQMSLRFCASTDSPLDGGLGGSQSWPLLLQQLHCYTLAHLQAPH